MSDRFFGPYTKPLRPHILEGGGISAEVKDLRSDVSEGFDKVAADIDLGKVKVSTDDTTAATLSSKLAAGSNVTLTVLNPGENEQISIASSGGSAGHTIQEGGTPLTARANLNFQTGLVAADDSGNGATTVNLETLSPSPAGSYSTANVTVDAQGRVTTVASNSATWSITQVRYFLVDNEAGDDINVGYVDAAAGATLTPAGLARKTIESIQTIIPTFGAGRKMVLLLKVRSDGGNFKKIDTVTDDSIYLKGLMGYAEVLVRGSTDLTNSVTDKIVLGAVPGLYCAGPNPDSSYTVDTGSTLNTIVITASPPPTGEGICGKRVRFLTGALAGAVNMLQEHSVSGTLNVTQDFASAPIAGDTFMLESPGVKVASFTLPSSWTVETCKVAGITFTTTATNGCAQGSVQTVLMAFLQGSYNVGQNILTFTKAGSVSIGSSYPDEAGTSRTTGVGLDSWSKTTVDAETFTLNRFVSHNIGTGSLSVTTYVRYSISQLVSENQITLYCPLGWTNNTLGTSATVRPSRLIGQVITLRGGGAIAVSRINFENPGPTRGGFTVDMFGGVVDFDGITGTSNSYGVDMGTSKNVLVRLGLTTANTITAALSEVRMNPEALFSFADLARCGAIDKSNNTVTGNATLFANIGRVITSAEAVSIPAGSILQATTTDTAQRAQADSSANASKVIGVALNTVAASGKIALCAADVCAVKFDAAPATGPVYLSEANLGQAKDAAPGVSGTNQKLRLGMTIGTLDTGYAAVALRPEIIPVTSDGNP